MIRRCLSCQRQSFTVPHRKFHLNFGATGIPHPDKALKGGEDGFFADSKNRTFGVADGVGGSANATTDPGLFSRGMLRHIRRSLSEEPARPSLHDALRDAAAALANEKIGGSSTVLLGRLVGKKIQLANIGDSACMVLRPSPRRFNSSTPGKKTTVNWPRIVLRTNDQTHYFNCPYQVCCDSFGQILKTNQCDFLEVEVQDGDIVIAATDGVFDNIFDQAMQLLVMKHLVNVQDGNAAALANAIATEAMSIGQSQDDPKTLTPFSEGARSEGYEYAGGKLDDVAVVVGLVVSNDGAVDQDPKVILHNLD